MPLVEHIRNEANTLKMKGISQHALDEAVATILNKAEDLAENRLSFSEEAVQNLFTSLEGSLRVLMKAGDVHKAHEKALSNLASNIGDETTPSEVKATFKRTVDEGMTTSDEALEREYEPLKKLKKFKMLADSNASGGAGPSGAGADDDLGDDGIAMTQVKRATNCPILYKPFSDSGDMRPVKASCGHVFSYKGIKDFLAGKRCPVACPQQGCARQIRGLSDFADDKDFIKELKKIARENARENAPYVD